MSAAGRGAHLASVHEFHVHSAIDDPAVLTPRRNKVKILYSASLAIPRIS